MLNKMSPFFAVIFSCLVLKEKVNVPQALFVIGAFLGSLLVIKPTFSNMDLFPSVIGLLGGLGAGIAYTYVRKATLHGEKGPFIVCFFSAFSCLVTLPFLIFDYHYMSLTQIGTLLAAGLAAAVYHYGSIQLCSGKRNLSLRLFADHIRSRTRILCIRSDSGSVKLDWLRSHLCNGSRYVFLQ